MLQIAHHGLYRGSVFSRFLLHRFSPRLYAGFSCASISLSYSLNVLTLRSQLSGLAKQASQITVYDVKSYYNQARNMVLNVSEMEAKVREATNDDPW